MFEDYIKNELKWPRPTSCKEMFSFLRFTGYYRSIEHFFKYFLDLQDITGVQNIFSNIS